MSYTAHTWVSDETITYQKLNNIEEGIQEAAQSGGGGYDLVIDYDIYTTTCSILSGDILDCEDKMDAGETINGVAIIHSNFSYTPSGRNTNKNSCYLPLVNFMGAYGSIYFGGTTTTNTNVMSYGLTIEYDSATGEIENVIYNSINLWSD